MALGRVRVSLDFECGWGVVQSGQWRLVEAAGTYDDLRSAMSHFTHRLDDLELSFTWAVVGGMIDEPSNRDVSHLRGDYARDMQIFLEEAKESTIDGRDLLDMVLSLRTQQTFGTHTYSHLLFSDPDQGSEVLLEDLKRAIRINKSLGLDASRLVFPRNHFGHFNILAEAGITHARMPPLNAPNPENQPPRLRRAFDTIARKIDSVSEFENSSGVILHHATEFLNWGCGASLPKRLLHRHRISKALELAQKGEDIHFWLHPFNLAQTAGFEKFVDTFLLKLADMRDEGKIEIVGF